MGARYDKLFEDYVDVLCELSEARRKVAKWKERYYKEVDALRGATDGVGVGRGRERGAVLQFNSSSSPFDEDDCQA